MKPRAANEPMFTFEIIDPQCDFSVIDFRAREWISAPYEVSLTLAKEKEIAFSDAIGKEALLEIAGKENRFFHGILSQFVKTGKKGAFYLYKATLVPDLWRLSLKQDCRIFQNMDTPAIVKDVLDKADITSVDVSNLTQYAKREYCVQYRETDLNFISRLLAEVGIFYFFEHANDDHKLVFGDSDSHYKDITGDTKVKFTQDLGEETVGTFVVSQHIHSDKVTLRDFRFRDPTNPLSKADPASDKDWERYDYPGGYCVHDTKKPDGSPKEDAADYDEIILEDKTDGAAHKNFAKIRQEEAEMFKERAEGQSNCPRFTPGFVFELTDHDLDDFDKEYVLLEMVHTGSQPQVLEAVAVRYENATYSNEFLCIPDTVTFRPLGYSHGWTGIPPSETFRPLKETPKPVVKGPQTAIVVKNDKKDGITQTSPATHADNVYTDKYGRVKVRFHWERPHDQGGKNEWYHSAWVRVSQTWAGQGWGAMHIPHVGQEVIVDFLEGDPDRPIITGRVYNAANEPHADMKPLDHRHISGLQDEGGNKLIFDATADQESIVLSSPKHTSSLIVGGDDGIKLETEKDKVEQVVGYWAEVGCGSKLEALVGFGLEAKLAQVYEVMVGQLVEVFLANKIEIGFGTEMAYKKTKELKAVEGDIQHDCKMDYKLTAGDGFCILGGREDKSKNESIINAYADGITLSLGPQEVDPESSFVSFPTWWMIVSVIASVLGLITAGAAKAVDGIGKHTGVDNKATTHLFGTLTGAIAFSQAIASTVIGVVKRDSVEPSFHEAPEAVIGMNKDGITLSINPTLTTKKDGINKEIWKNSIEELKEETKADSKIMMKNDGAITINSKNKSVELGVGEEDGIRSEISIDQYKIKLSCGEKGEYGIMEFNNEDGDVAIKHGGASFLISRNGKLAINAKGDSYLTTQTGDINITPGGGKKTKIKGLVDLG